MPKITFTINQETGEYTPHIEGVKGPACDDVAKIIKEVFGAPSSEVQTSEYHERVVTRKATVGH